MPEPFNRARAYLSSSRNGTTALLAVQSFEAALLGNFFLELHHQLLVASRIGLILVQLPAQELVGVVRLKSLFQHAQPLAILRDLLPIALDVLQGAREVRKRSLEDLAVQRRRHGRLKGFVLSPSFFRAGKDEIRRLLDGLHEGADFAWVLCDEGLVADVQDRAEAAAAQLGEFVDAKHLHVGLGSGLGSEPFLELHHLHILKANPRVDLAVDDGARDVHAAAYGGVVGGGHAVVRGELVDLDLVRCEDQLRGGMFERRSRAYLAKLADVADAFALKSAEVGCNPRIFQVDDAGKGLVEERADGEYREVAGFGLSRTISGWFSVGKPVWSRTYGQSVNHGFESQVNLAGANDLCDIARVIRLQKSNLDSLVLEESLGLGQVQRSVIRRGVPFHQNVSLRSATHAKNEWAAQPVRQEGDLVGRHGDGAAAIQSIFPSLWAQTGIGGRKHVLIAAIMLIKFVTVYSQRARQSTSLRRLDSPRLGVMTRVEETA
jgi:hypothetical protein